MKHKTLLNLNIFLEKVKLGSNEYEMIDLLSKKAGFRGFDKFIDGYGNERMTVKEAMAYLLSQF